MSVTYTNTTIRYIKNAVNACDSGSIIYTATDKYYTQNTGWHVIPNHNWRDLMTYKDWYHMSTNYEYVCPKSLTVQVQNLIPLTDDLSIAQDTTFMSFNNTIYALTYEDRLYETGIQEFADPKIYYREGFGYNVATGAIEKKYLPIYLHRLPALSGTTALVQAFWDPLVHSSHLGELRPGKNSVTYNWSRHSADNDKWVCLNRFFRTDKEYDLTNKAVFAQNDTNYNNSPITPGELWKQDPRNDTMYTSKAVEYKYYWKYPIHNMFIKMIPIMDSKGNLMKHEGQVVITTKFTLDVKKSTKANNMPRYDYHAVDTDQVYKSIRQPQFGFYKSALAPPTILSQPPFGDDIESKSKNPVPPQEDMQ